jgi:hypothetical protein
MRSALPSILGFLLLAHPVAAAEYFAAPADLAGADLWTNYLRLSDIDGDDDLDVVVPNCGGFFGFDGPAEPQAFKILLNNGDAGFTDETSALTGELEQSLRQVAIGDIDNDGDVDLYLPDAAAQDPDRLFVADGGDFNDEAEQRLGGISSSAGAARFGDFDGDGDLDLLVLNGYLGTDADGGMLYLNAGPGTFSEAPTALPAIVGGADPTDVDLIDIDRDFDLDVLVDVHEGELLLWRNEGDATFTDASDSLAPAGIGSNYHYNPAVCDLDGDDDLDIIIDNTGGGYREQVLINNGSGVFADETATRIPGDNNVAGADDNGLSCIDVNGDGAFDLAVSALLSSGGTDRLLINDGEGIFALEADGFADQGDSTLWFEFGDLDDDGRLDGVTGQGESGDFTNRFFLGVGPNVVDTRPPRVLATETPVALADTPLAVRFAVSDNVVSDEGPRLGRAYLAVSAPASEEIDARFSGGDLFRAVLPAQPDGTLVTFEACAVDRQGNQGCGEEVTIVIGETSGAGGAGAGGGPSGSVSSGVGASAGDPDERVEEGCGCRVIGARTPALGPALLFAAVWALAWRRRRGHARAA